LVWAVVDLGGHISITGTGSWPDQYPTPGTHHRPNSARPAVLADTVNGAFPYLCCLVCVVLYWRLGWSMKVIVYLVVTVEKLLVFGDVLEKIQMLLYKMLLCVYFDNIFTRATLFDSVILKIF